MVVAEGAPSYGGHELARKLAQAGLHTTAIADAAIFAMMARVNKVRDLLVLQSTGVWLLGMQAERYDILLHAA